MPHPAGESPFDNPPLMDGYPLDKAERHELHKAIRDLDQSSPAHDDRSSEPAQRGAERPAVASA